MLCYNKFYYLSLHAHLCSKYSLKHSTLCSLVLGLVAQYDHRSAHNGVGHEGADAHELHQLFDVEEEGNQGRHHAAYQHVQHRQLEGVKGGFKVVLGGLKEV